MSEQTIFLDALEQADPRARAAYLAAACAGNPTLRARIEALLASHAQCGTFLDTTLIEQAAAAEESLAFLEPADMPGALGRLDHYDVLEVLGRGGMGVVLKARDAKLERVVALKVLARHLAASPSARRQFVHEARAAAAIRDEHVVTVYAVNDDGPRPYLAMEYIAGITLQQRLDCGPALALDEAVRIGVQLAHGLAAAHVRGLVHRDVKPGNILLEADTGRVLLTDFGLAETIGTTAGGVIAGTPMFMSPEQARGAAIDERSDLFSLGSVLYLLCTGTAPFAPGDTTEVLQRVADDMPSRRAEQPALPAWLRDLLAQLHAKDPSARPAGAREVADRLSAGLKRLERRAIPRWRRPRVALAALALLVALGLLAVYWPRDSFVAPIGWLGPPVFLSLELRRADIPPRLLALAGGGDPEQAPAELAAVLGDGRFLLPHVGQTAWMDQSPDGRLLAVPLDEDVILFDAARGAQVGRLPGPGGRAFVVAFSRDSELLALSTRREAAGGAVRVWDLGTRHVLFTQPQPGPTISCAAAFSVDGQRLFTEVAGRVQVWDARTGRALDSVPVHASGIASLCVSPDGKRLAAASWRGNSIQVFDGADGQLKAADRTLGHPWPTTVAVYSRDGHWLASSDLTGFKVWDAATLTERFAARAPAHQLAFAPDSRTLVTATTADQPRTSYTVHRWDVVTRKELSALSIPVAAEPMRAFMHLSRDGQTLFVAAQHGATYVKAIDTTTGQERFPRAGHTEAVHAVAVSPDGRTLASAGADCVVKLWDLTTGRVRHTLTAHTGTVVTLAFSPNGRQLASGSRDATIALWDVAEGSETRALHGHARTFARLQFSPDGRTLAAGGEAGIVKQWEVASGKEATPRPGHAGLVRCVAYHASGNLLASGGEDRTIRLHDLTGGASAPIHLPGVVNDVAFAPDGRTLAAVGAEPKPFVYVRDLATGRETTLPGDTGAVWSVALSPSSPLLATGGEDGTVRFWSVPANAADTVAPVRTIGPGPFGGPVRSIAFTPDGRYLATANANGTIYLLRVPE